VRRDIIAPDAPFSTGYGVARQLQRIMTMRQPTIFLSHGGGPCFWMDFPPPFGPHAFDRLRAYLAGLLQTLPERPKSILLVSAHWEEAAPTVGSSATPGMIYDYYGFPDETYHLLYPAPGAPQLAQRVRGLLAAQGLECREDAGRGFDHGVFVPMMIIDAKAEIPVATLSLQRDLSPRLHLAIGAALAPLRDEGVLIIGSGNSFHNLRTFFDGQAGVSAQFDDWLTQTVKTPDPQSRSDKLAAWDMAPGARLSHPREEHLLPLMVVMGAAGADSGARVYHDRIANKAISGYAFG
jgi:aromatic ring-opening dioxygenase catalytic subunit (LigB family)